MRSPIAWPFLVAAGRTRDYSTLLAPEFLVTDLDYGFLDEVVRPAEGGPSVTDVRTRAGRRLTVVYATHALPAADVDEHGRPLRLIYGFVTAELVAEPAPEDLRTALDVALPVYRRFRQDENTVAVAAGLPYPLRSLVHKAFAAPVSARRNPRTATMVVGGLAVVAAIAATLAVTTPSPTPPPQCPAASRFEPSPAADVPEPAVSPSGRCPKPGWK
jgi:hypothetical protein